MKFFCLRILERVGFNRLQGCNLTVDNLYTSIPLAEILLAKNVKLLGTMRHNRKGLSKDITTTSGREEFSTVVWHRISGSEEQGSEDEQLGNSLEEDLDLHTEMARTSGQGSQGSSRGGGLQVDRVEGQLDLSQSSNSLEGDLGEARVARSQARLARTSGQGAQGRRGRGGLQADRVEGQPDLSQSSNRLEGDLGEASVTRTSGSRGRGSRGRGGLPATVYSRQSGQPESSQLGNSPEEDVDSEPARKQPRMTLGFGTGRVEGRLDSSKSSSSLEEDLGEGPARR